MHLLYKLDKGDTYQGTNTQLPFGDDNEVVSSSDSTARSLRVRPVREGALAVTKICTRVNPQL